MEGKWLYVLMGIAAVVMFYANNEYKSKGVTWGRPLAGLCGIIAVFFALLQMGVTTCEDDWERDKMMDRESEILHASMEHIGDYIGSNFTGSRMLLITNAETEYNADRQDIMLDGLKDGLKKRVKIHAREAPKGSMGMDQGLPLGPDAHQFSGESFDKLVETHPECDLILTLIGLPMDMRQMRFWEIEENRPKLITVFGSVYELRTAIREGYVSAAVVHNPKYKYDVDGEVPDDPKAAFSQRYLLIDASNVEKIATDHFGMFRDEPVQEEVDEEEKQ